MYDIICIGSAGQDIFFPLHDVEIHNTPEDLMAQKHMLLELGAKYRTVNRYESPGGGAMNISIGLARLGIKSAAHTAVGDDSFADNIEAILKEEGVSRRGVRRMRGAKTDVSCVLVDTRSADRTIVYNRDTSECFRVEEPFIRKGRAVFISSLCGKWESNIETTLRASKKSGKQLFYNPSQRNIADCPDRVLKIIQSSEGLFVNKDEAMEIVLRGMSRVDKNKANDEVYLLKMLAGAGPRFVVLTDGVRGAWVFDGEQVLSARPQPVRKALDSTGAGDAFTSAFLSGYLQGEDMILCLKRGVVNSRSVVQHYGALEGLLRKAEIASPMSTIEVKVM